MSVDVGAGTSAGEARRTRALSAGRRAQGAVVVYLQHKSFVPSFFAFFPHQQQVRFVTMDLKTFFFWVAV